MMAEAITDNSESNSSERVAMGDLIDDLRKHSAYLYGENVGECRELMRRAAEEISALRAAAVRVGWQPIETAPKDGTTILAGYWRGTFWCVDTTKWEGDGWWQMRQNTPTHWQRLPQPPQRVG